MFDLIKEAYLELNGHDIKKIKEEKIAREKLKKSERFIFTKIQKHMIRFAGILYLMIALVSTSMFFKNSNYIMVALFLIMIIIDLLIMILISIKTIQTERIGLGLLIFSFFVNFLIPLIRF